MEKKLIIIAGPTASGKTQLAIEVAKELKTEIISCDSRQFYQEISIGTAKPTPSQLAEVKHHFIGNISVKDEYNAGAYENDAIKLIEQLFKKYDTLVLTGGSGLYIDAVMYGLDDLPKVDDRVRDRLNKLLRNEGIGILQTMLAENDPDYYKEVDKKNPHRLIRALEVTLSTGIPFSKQRKSVHKQRSFKTLLFGLDIEREQLYSQINHRVDTMMNLGLLDEVKSVSSLRNWNALQTVGYKELFEYLAGNMQLHTAVELIKQNTRNFAKRQLTWFKKYENMIWLKPYEALDKIIETVNKK